MTVPRSIKEVSLIVAMALGVMVAVLLPLYTVYAINQDSQAVLQQLEDNAVAATERAVRVNVLTVSCMLLIPNEERDNFGMAECIRTGLAEFDKPLGEE